jgi:hypothetical protein
MEVESTVTPSRVEGWLSRLAADCAANPRGKAGMAAAMGISRPYIARALSTGKSALLPSQMESLRARYLTFVGELRCPSTGEVVERAVCLAGHASAPTHNPSRMMIWKTCQRCSLRPRAPVQEN